MNDLTRHPGYLELAGVSRSFGPVAAVSDVSLSVARGEVICLVGPSGCGKSTLLRLIAGVDGGTGRIALQGKVIADHGLFTQPEDRNIGFMFQDYALFPHLSVTDNILFGLKKLPRIAAQAAARDMIARLGIDHLADRFPHMLSGGEQQRVALARALAPKPHVMLMDEPFSNLDRKLRDGIREETLSILRALETTVVMVTHDPEEALSSGDRVVLMDGGRIVQTGTGPQVYDAPASAYAADFFCDFNHIPAICRNGIARTPLGDFDAPFPDGTAVTVYVRPQSLSLTKGDDAEVLDVTLMGEIEQTRLALAGLSLRMRSTNRSGLRPGQRVRATAAAALVFA